MSNSRVSTWSGIRNKLENDYLCPALRGHIQYFATSYSKSADHEGRAAIRVDGVEVLRSNYYTYFENVWTKFHHLRSTTLKDHDSAKEAINQAYLVSCSRSRTYDMLRKQREEPLEEVPDAPDDAPVPDDAAVSTDNIQYLTELIGQMKPMYRDPLRLLAMGYTNREIAESLGLTDEVVRMRLFRGRKLLWKELNSRE